MLVVPEPAPYPRRVVVGLCLGHGGMSVLINLIAILVVYFYLPPESAGLPDLVTDATFFHVLNAIVLIAAAGRLLDAVTDPLIASGSDRSRHRLGRRIPFMRAGAVPAAVATVALFVPPVGHESGWNIVWLLGVQAVLYVALTAYVTPAFSLVADLGRTPMERLDLATWTSVAWAGGIMVAALTPFLSEVYGWVGLSPIRSWQASVTTVCTVALAAMWAPIRLIDEPSLSRSAPTSVPLRRAVRLVATNPFFRFYLAADFAYFSGLTIVQTGLLYYVTVLLELDETVTAPLLVLMVVVATFLYPAVNRVAKRRSGRQLVVFAFLVSAFDFLGVVFLGLFPMPNWLEAVVLILAFSVPFAVLSVVPQWILSDIAEHAAIRTGQATAATFFAARTFMQKLGQTIGVMAFALLASFGRDVGDDLGIRLSGVAGVVLYLVAALAFRHYDETTLQGELAAGRPTTDRSCSSTPGRAADRRRGTDRVARSYRPTGLRSSPHEQSPDHRRAAAGRGSGDRPLDRAGRPRGRGCGPDGPGLPSGDGLVGGVRSATRRLRERVSGPAAIDARPRRLVARSGHRGQRDRPVPRREPRSAPRGRRRRPARLAPRVARTRREHAEASDPRRHLLRRGLRPARTRQWHPVRDLNPCYRHEKPAS